MALILVEVTEFDEIFPTHTHTIKMIPQNTSPTISLKPVRSGFFTRMTLAVAAVGMTALAGSLYADSVTVPNSSFENPTTVYADPNITSWTKSSQPFWWDAESYGDWNNLSGVFLNTAPGAGDHIDNMTGTQAAFMLAVPTVGLTQDLSATFEAGKSFDITVGIIGGGGGMAAGATFEIGLYYMNGGNMTMIATNDITFDGTTNVFANTNHFVDFTAHLSGVQAGDAWAGKNIGVALTSVYAPPDTGGYWDVDNVRVTATTVPEPSSWALIVLGFGSMFLMRRRFARQA